MSARAGSGYALLFVLSTIAGCAAQQDEGMPSDADRSADFDVPADASAPAMEPGASPVERDLDQMQRELAVNEAKLRALGVVLPSSASEHQGLLLQEDEAPPAEAKPSIGGATKGDAPSPETSTKPSAAPSGGERSAKDKKSRREHERKTIEPHRAPEMAPPAGEPAPDQAKAAPISPNTQTREQDAAGRCLMICDLSQITCELNTQICELADRHGDQDDYRAACDHAAEDCEVAQEACDACVG